MTIPAKQFSAGMTASAPIHPGGPRPRILGIGGTLRPGSSSEKALRLSVSAAARFGATTEILTASELNLPAYDYGNADCDGARVLLDAVRRADCLIICTPGYHGGISELLKNALDYLEGLAADTSPYLQNKAVGCIVTAAGWQAGASTLASLRATIHALRGWPTPLGAIVNSALAPFGDTGEASDLRVAQQLEIVGSEVVSFALTRIIPQEGPALAASVG